MLRQQLLAAATPAAAAGAAAAQIACFIRFYCAGLPIRISEHCRLCTVCRRAQAGGRTSRWWLQRRASQMVGDYAVYQAVKAYAAAAPVALRLRWAAAASSKTVVSGITRPCHHAGYEHSPLRAAFTSLVAVLHAIGTTRGQPALLSPGELTAYGAALASHRTADRMAFAGGAAGGLLFALLPPLLLLLADWHAAALACFAVNCPNTARRSNGSQTLCAPPYASPLSQPS